MNLIFEYHATYLLIISSRLVVASVLLAAGLMKVVRPPNWAPLVQGLGLPSIGSQNFIVRALALAEVASALWLFSGWLITYGLSFVVLLFSGFFVIQSTAIRRGYKGGCACFGANENAQIGFIQRARSIVLLLTAGFALLGSSERYGAQPPVWASPGVVFVLAGIILVAGTAIYSLSAEIETLVRRPSFETFN